MHVHHHLRSLLQIITDFGFFFFLLYFATGFQSYKSGPWQHTNGKKCTTCEKCTHTYMGRITRIVQALLSLNYSTFLPSMYTSISSTRYNRTEESSHQILYTIIRNKKVVTCVISCYHWPTDIVQVIAYTLSHSICCSCLF